MRRECRVELWGACPRYRVGTRRTALLYLSTGFVGCLFSAAAAMLFGRVSVSVGASGAILGIIGAQIMWLVQG